jgi:O-antigen ligase
MKLEAIKNLTATTLAAGSAVITLFVMTNLNSDPVNAPKLALLGVLSGLITPLIIISFKSELNKKFSAFFFINCIFGAVIVATLFLANSPISQMLYGVYGRNTGVLAYLFCIVLSLGASQLDSRKQIERIVIGFALAGVVNVLYSGWVLLFDDFVGWQNPYGTILGTFGNPNFVSAFLGMFIALSVSYTFSEKTRKSFRVSLLFLMGVTFIEIVSSKSIQGIFLTAGAIVIVTFHYLRTRFASRILNLTYLTFAVVLGLTAILGALQKGPFNFIYKKSVSLRGTYWNTGLDMGRENLFFGVGFDGYGDWYRRSRPPVALLDTPGVNTGSNSAHNVFIDIFASGGIFAVTGYLLITLLGTRSILLVMKRSTTFDPLFVAISTMWICYQAQSIISINQIGLMIWGWLFTGILISFEKITRSNSPRNELHKDSGGQSKKQKTSSSLVFSLFFLGGIAGSIISSPPMSSDIKWSSAQKSRELEQIESSLSPSYFNPPNITKYLNASNLFLTNNLPIKGLKYAEAAVHFNPDSFDAWKFVYAIPATSPERREIALLNMKRLDPQNPDVTNFK